MSDLRKIPHELDEARVICLAIVETPKGRRGKYNYDAATGLFRLKSLLPEGMSFPLDFGFVPSTRGGDGDPIDIMILGDEPAPVGGLVTARLIGVLEAEDEEDGRTERNDRLLAVAVPSHLYGSIRSVDQLDKTFVDHLAQFWINKDRLEGKTFRLLGVGRAEAAIRLIREGAERAGRGADARRNRPTT